MDIIKYKTQGTCSEYIEVKIENDIIEDIVFYGGCNGNLKGISSLCRGMNINDVISKLKGIRCNSKSTSCPDQLSCALIEYVQNQSRVKSNT